MYDDFKTAGGKKFGAPEHVAAMNYRGGCQKVPSWEYVQQILAGLGKLSADVEILKQIHKAELKECKWDIPAQEKCSKLYCEHCEDGIEIEVTEG